MPGGRRGMVPPVPASFVWRTRLDGLLNEALRRRLTVVTAGPGYGKTTLRWGWAARVGASWYAGEPPDSALRALAGGLLDALGSRLAVTNPGERAIRSSGGEGEDPAQAERLATLLLTALEGGRPG